MNCNYTGAAYADASAGHGIDAGAAVGSSKYNSQGVETNPIPEKSDHDSPSTPHTVYVQKVRPRKYYRLNKVSWFLHSPCSESDNFF